LEDVSACADIYVKSSKFTVHVAFHLFQQGSRRTLFEHFKLQGRDITDSQTLAALEYPH